jgi:hypothetical protein
MSAQESRLPAFVHPYCSVGKNGALNFCDWLPTGLVEVQRELGRFDSAKVGRNHQGPGYAA